MSEIMTWACRKGFHTWAKWKDLGPGTVATGLRRAEQDVLFQESRCVRCNAAKRRTVYLNV